MAVSIFNNNISKAFTGGLPVKAIYSLGQKVWPSEEPEPTATWVEKHWDNNIYPYQGFRVWKSTIGTFGRTSDGRDIVLLSGEENPHAWQYQSFTGTPSNFDGSYVWQDFDGIAHYSLDRQQYYLNGTRWISDTSTGFKPFGGDHVYKVNDTTILYSWGNEQYGYDGSKWNVWNNPDASQIADGSKVWTVDGYDSAFYDNGDTSLVVDYQNIFEFGHLAIIGDEEIPIPIDGSKVWHDGNGNTYYNDETYSLQLVIEDGDLMSCYWIEKEWNIDLSYPENIWHDNFGHTYYSAGSKQYQLMD